MGSLNQIAVARHEYGLRKTQKAGYLFLAVVFGGMAALVLVLGSSNPDPTGVILAGAALAAAALYLALVALRSRFIIDGTRVRVQGALRSRDFDLSEVEGYRTYKGRYQTFQVICLKDHAWKIPLMKYQTDEHLDDWFAHLKDLDQQDRDQLLEKIDQDQELGATPEERRGALSRAKQFTIAAWVVDGGAAAAFAFGPANYRLAAMTVVALAPLAAAWMLYRQPLLYGVFNPRRDPRGDLSFVIMISGFALLFGSAGINFISVGMLLPYIAFGALALLAMFYPAARRNPRFAGTMMGLVVLSAFYGWGVAASVDTAADRSSPQNYSAQVLGGHVSRGSRSTTYYLELEPWGPYAAVDTRMKVSASTYNATHTGDIVCLALHSGALRAPWYELIPCQDGSSPPANP